MALNENLDAFKTSVVPSDLTKEYLSSSNGKNTSSDPAVGLVAPVISFDAILTVKDFLIVKDALVKSTSETFGLGSTVILQSFRILTQSERFLH